MRYIEISVDMATGQEKVEAIGFSGQQCSLDVDGILRLIGAKRTGAEISKNEQTVRAETVRAQ